MQLALDVFYAGDRAKAVAVLFDWKDSTPHEVYEEDFVGVAEYVPGEFYKRELPCLLKLLTRVKLETVEAIVIDGYVFLDETEKLGLGGHLYNAMEKKIPVIGVAKTPYHGMRHTAKQVLRGNSKNPLYITAVGMELTKATERIRAMHGDYRLPDILKRLDQLTKQEQ